MAPIFLEVNPMKDMKERGKKAALRYLAIRGYDILEENYKGFVVAYDKCNDVLSFVNVTTSEGDFEVDLCSVSHFEKTSISYLKDHGEHVDLPVTYDEMSICVVGDNRAFLRHMISAESHLKEE